MNKKTIITLVFTTLLSVSVSAQGLFKSEDSASNTSNRTSSTAPASGDGEGVALFAGKPEKPSHPGETGEGPIGGGLAILTLLSGGYYLLKRRNLNKEGHEA